MAYPSTPPSVDLSRAKLKQLTSWIRDGLDLLVAREGPDILRPDDVLYLHETFIALKQSQYITVLDLRATGIHRAVQDIAGVATRWPGRLCDDCDKIISIWTARFGPFGALHPFIYGRGGRLEGIASAAEQSKEALIKRWMEICPEHLHLKRSHRYGDLGFRAGAWWINPMFAHHAGIIGIESTEGGTTFDKHGAYALVLKDTGEVEACSGERFTYRCPQDDKGKFRLTSATPRSREPIRVLRSHSINSIWGPKAGIRYEGLYAVKGWSIRTSGATNTAGEQRKEGNIMFEIRLERCDQVPMDEVIRHPTATEVDDYSEYKRLRRKHREEKRKGPSTQVSGNEGDNVRKAAPPIAPMLPQVPSVVSPTSLPRPVPRTPSKSMFKRLHFNEEAHVHFSIGEDVVSPLSVPDTNQLDFSTARTDTDAVPVVNRKEIWPDKTHLRISPPSSPTSSGHLSIREVAPWIDFDPGLQTSSPATEPPIIREETRSHFLKSSTEWKQDSVSAIQHDDPREMRDSLGSIEQQARKKSSDLRSAKAFLNPPTLSKKGTHKSIFIRSRNPMAKLYDGVSEQVNAWRRSDIPILQDTVPDADTDTPRFPQHQRSSSADATLRIQAHVPVKSVRSESLLITSTMARRDAVYGVDNIAGFPMMPVARIDSMATLMLPSNEPCEAEFEALRNSSASSLPISLKRLISAPEGGQANTSTTSPARFSLPKGEESAGEALLAPSPSTATAYPMRGLEIKVSFTNPFEHSPTQAWRTLERESSSVAPDASD